MLLQGSKPRVNLSAFFNLLFKHWWVQGTHNGATVYDDLKMRYAIVQDFNQWKIRLMYWNWNIQKLNMKLCSKSSLQKRTLYRKLDHLSHSEQLDHPSHSELNGKSCLESIFAIIMFQFDKFKNNLIRKLMY